MSSLPSYTPYLRRPDPGVAKINPEREPGRFFAAVRDELAPGGLGRVVAQSDLAPTIKIAGSLHAVGRLRCDNFDLI